MPSFTLGLVMGLTLGAALAYIVTADPQNPYGVGFRHGWEAAKSFYERMR